MAHQVNTYTVFANFKHINIVNITQASDEKIKEGKIPPLITRLVNRVQPFLPPKNAKVPSKSGDNTNFASARTASRFAEIPDPEPQQTTVTTVANGVDNFDTTEEPPKKKQGMAI